jgi:type VI secretion system protein ImpM
MAALSVRGLAVDGTACSGLYGKIPALGDFVTCRLPTQFVETWDAWLQSCLNQWRLAQGNGWSNRFDAAGGFRFALEADVCGPAAAIGVAIASSDRVGRRFPLTIAAVLPTGMSAAALAMRAGAWFAEAADTLRAIGHEVFESPTQIESMMLRLDPMLAALAEPTATMASSSVAALMQGMSSHLSSASDAELPVFVATLYADQITRRQPRLALFWTDAPRLNLWSCAGLPAAESFASMFSMVVSTPRAQPEFPAAKSPPLWQETVLAAEPAASAGAALRTDAHLLIAVPNVAYVAFGAASDEPRDPTAVAQRFRSEFARSASAPGACQATLGAEAESCAAWLPDEEGGAYVWCGTATIFRLRGDDLERLTGEDQEDSGAGDSLADLLGGGDGGAIPSAAATARRAADVRAGDRILLCADGSYGRLSWAQLVSALREQQLGLAARRLQEAWTQPSARVPGAIVIAFDSEDDALVATHATVAARPAAAIA